MTRRPVLPGASELFFRRTDAPTASAAPTMATLAPAPAIEAPPLRLVDATPVAARTTAAATAAPAAPRAPAAAPRTRSGRVRHEEKITVYLSAAELLGLEQARLTLRSDHGIAADRGALVRTAIAVLLDDLDTNGDNSVLVHRLQAR